jgi:hypothetical protein
MRGDIAETVMVFLLPGVSHGAVSSNGRFPHESRHVASEPDAQ